MAGPAPVELTADCPHCGLEGGVVEIYDAMVAACRFGIPSKTRCKLCAATSEGTFDKAPKKALAEIPANRCPACESELGPSALDDKHCAACGAMAALADIGHPAPLTNLDELAAALDAWARRESFASRAELLTATFVEPDESAILARLQAQEPIEIVGDPFANMGMRTTGGKPRQERQKKPAPPAEPSAPATTMGDSPVAMSVAQPPDPGLPFAPTDPLSAPMRASTPSAPHAPSAPRRRRRSIWGRPAPRRLARSSTRSSAWSPPTARSTRRSASSSTASSRAKGSRR